LALDGPSGHVLKMLWGSLVWVFVQKENKMPKHKSGEMWAKIRADKAARDKLASELGRYGISASVTKYRIQETFEAGKTQWGIYFDGKFVSVHSSYFEANQEIIRLLGK
jgi:hypothetical protein